tara:strand:+ start:9633 stop:10556 length:924 start_codon:yes stop_codon:yes gene_type:complete
MEEKKVFSINPDLFTFKKGNTRKKEKSVSKEKIKMKSIPKENNNKNESVRKRSILKMIREHHYEKNKDNFSNYERKLKPPTSTDDFEQAKTFFDNMVVKNENRNHNYTLKNTNETQKTTPIIDTSVQLTQPIHPDIKIHEEPITLSDTQISSPKYGCLKNGNLPTFRDYMNRTRKVENIDNDSSQKANIIIQTQEKLKNLKKKRKKYRKKTIKRTYKIGRSKVKPEISVLISNKTMRNNIVQKKQLMKQVPITEIRAYLMKHGFIKIGTTTPNDVLRQMYEAALLVCGEVQNHNKETLMFNFLNNND